MAVSLQRDTWVRLATALAVGTVAWNVLEGIAAVWLGIADESIALLGFGLDSWVEVGSAGVVLWRLRSDARGGCKTTALRKERSATRVVGILLTVLAATIGIGAVAQLATFGHPETTVPGLIVAGLSLSFMFALWWGKKQAAVALDSRTLEADAACSLGCIQLSITLLAGSLLYAVAPVLWWADGVAALVLGGLIAREGIGTVRASLRKDFTGGCGCS